MSDKVHVWDLPLRLFHWLLVLSVSAAYITGELGGSLVDWHGRIGVLVLALLTFRLIWGVVGTTHAKFINFFPTPSRLIDYYKGRWQGHGHNPLGALSVLALLGVLAALVGTGLFSNDDIAFHGPLFDLVDKDLSDNLSGWHRWIFDVLTALVGLHIAAIAFYLIVKEHDLIRPMITGKKAVKAPAQDSGVARGWLARFLIAAVIAGAVAWTVHSGWLVDYLQPPALPASTDAPPAW